MKDREGDRARGRRTAPLVMGDRAAGCTIAVPVLTWSVICPLFLGLGFPGYLATRGVGIVMAWGMLRLQNVQADRNTWKIWSAWIALLQFLPMLQNRSFIDECICLTWRRALGSISFVGIRRQCCRIDVGNAVLNPIKSTG